jgi:hypothetical protein
MSRLQNIEQTVKRFNDRFGYEKKKPLKEMSVRDMMGIMRKLNEDINALSDGALSGAELDREQEKIKNYFANENVNVEFKEIFVKKDKGVIAYGSVDDQLFFYYTVSSDAKESGVQLEYLDGFDQRNPNNDKIVKMVQQYYNDFYKYWRDNTLQLDTE